MEEVVVCVIGGCGFLGQHIVRELQRWNARQEERRKSSPTAENAGFHDNESFDEILDLGEAMDSDDGNILRKDSDNDDADYETRHVNIKEIKILDIKAFNPFLEFADYPLISYKKCDIRLESTLSTELEGVKVVFHCAAAMPSIWTKSNVDKEQEVLYWETNLEGTENVIWACKKADVKILVYTSTITAVMGGQMIAAHTETLSPVIKEKELVLGAYARSRRRAEDIVINAHKSPTENEYELLTTVLRPVALFGEGDTRFIPSLIDMAKRSGGKLPSIGTETSFHQLTYAGNAAYAHVCAMMQLMRKVLHPLRDCGGVAIYVCDDSPYGSSHTILKPFLQNFGLSTTPNHMPLFATLLFTAFVDLWSSMLNKVGCASGLELSHPSYTLQSIAGKTTIVNRTRAELALQFRPLYSWYEAKENSLNYYEKIIEARAMKALENRK